MSRRSVRKEGFSLLGVSVVACVACCAGPILGVLGGISLAGLASTVVIGSVGFVIAAIAATAWLLVRRTRHPASLTEDAAGPVAVGSPTRKQ